MNPQVPQAPVTILRDTFGLISFVIPIRCDGDGHFQFVDPVDARGKFMLYLQECFAAGRGEPAPARPGEPKREGPGPLLDACSQAAAIIRGMPHTLFCDGVGSFEGRRAEVDDRLAAAFLPVAPAHYDFISETLAETSACLWSGPELQGRLNRHLIAQEVVTSGLIAELTSTIRLCKT